MRSSERLPRVNRVAVVPPERPPVLTVLVDAEEEFDWEGGFDRRATSVSAMKRIDRLQRVFDAAGVTPLYVADYPVVEKPEGYKPLADIHSDGRCVIGSHLHPWVNPPFDEHVTPRNSFPGNLAPELEKAKLRALTELIGERFGEAPTVYQAGRYGLGPSTADTLEELGYEVDYSACPPFDYTSEEGPDYSRCPLEPYWFGRERSLLGIPCTGAYVGYLSGVGHAVHSLAQMPELRWARIPGLLSRAGALDRLRLSPEGFSLRDLRRLTHSLLAQGVRVFTYSLHSPSVTPGCTSYVSNENDVARFLDDIRSYFEFFFGELGGRSATPLEVKAELESPVAEGPSLA